MKAFGAKAAGARLERMRASAGWVAGGADERGGGFRNRYAVLPGLRDANAERPRLSDFLCHAGRRVPAGPLPIDDPRAAWVAPAASGLRTTWLGHSTVLVELDGAVLLTDPVWGLRASPTQLAGPKRFHPAPVALKTLLEQRPPSAVLLSHDHYDHLDMPTVRELVRASHGALPFITSLGVGAHLEAFGVPAACITELDWWQSCRVPGSEVVVTAAPSQHFSGRSLKDRNATLWSSFVIKGPRHAVFFSGDTGLTPAYREIATKFGPFDLVMLEVGAFHPSWGDIHLGPVNALQAAAWLGGAPLLPVHWSTFSLALHAWDEPAETLIARAAEFGVSLVMPRLGEVVEPGRRDGTLRPWWRDVGQRWPEPVPVQASPEAGIAPAASRRVWTWPAD